VPRFLMVTLLFLLTSLLIQPAFAANELDIGTLTQPQKIWPLGEYQKTDPKKTLNQLITDNQWLPTTDKPPSHGFTDQAVWLRFTIKNSSDLDKSIRYFWHHSQIHEVDVFVVKDDELISRQKLDTLIPIDERPLKTRMIEWVTKVPAKTQYDVYIRTASAFAISFRIKAGSPKDIEGISRFTENAAYLYIGIMLALVIYNLPMAITANYHAHWFYLIYVIAVTLYVISLRGFLFQLGWYETVIWEQRVTFSTVPIFLGASLLFAGEFLNINDTPRVFRYGYKVLLTGLAFVFLLCIFPEPHGALTLVPPLALVTILFTLVLSGFRILQRHYYAVFIFFGWLSMLFGIAGHQISVFVGIQSDFVGLAAIMLATVIEATLFSWALGYRFNQLKKENVDLEKSRLSALEQANKQLLENIEIESKANSQKDNLLNTVSQELKKPLHQIQSAIELAISDKKRTISGDRFDSLTSGVDYLRRNVSNIILLAEINAGEIEPVIQSSPLSTLISDIEDTAEDSKHPGQTWQFVNQIPDRPIINIDIRLLHILLENLIENAFKFSPGGNVRLTLNTTTPESIGMLEWTLIDDGIGIDEYQFDHIFELFYQQKHTQGEMINGMGIGLPLVNKIADLLGGELKIESHLGKGTEIKFIHPIDSQNINHSLARLKTTNRPKVLIAEHHPINAQLLETQMSKLGYITRVVDNGIKVIDAVKEADYNMVMINIDMPVMDGIETAIFVREKGYLGILLAISANDTNETRKRAIEAGFNDFIDKPIRFKKLKNQINNIELLQMQP